MTHGDGMMTMAQAVGDHDYPALTFIGGIDFDPTDPEEVEIVKLATERDAHDRMRALEDENHRLRMELAALRGDDA